MKMVRIATEVPNDFMPTDETSYIFNQRLLDNTTPSARTGRLADKEYNIRVYAYDDHPWRSRNQVGMPIEGNVLYGVIAFYGRERGNLKADWKGSFITQEEALSVARDLIRSKRMKGYRIHPVGVNARVPGHSENEPARPPDQQPQPQVQPSAKMPEPQPEKVKPEEKYQVEINPKHEELIGANKMKLIKIAQPREPDAPDYYKHSDYEEVANFLTEHEMAVVNVGRDTAIIYKVLAHRDNRWVLYTQDAESKNPHGIAAEVLRANPNNMNVLGTYDTKEAAAQAAIRNIRMREEFRPPEPEQPKEEEKEPEKNAPPPPPVQRGEINPKYEELIGSKKLNWYKRSSIQKS